MPTLHLLRVFCSEDGSGGNPLGVFLDGAEVPPERRQAVAADLGLSETVFVDDAERGEVRIFTPAVELDFAGHPAVGTAWLLEGVDALRPPGRRGPGAARRRERLREPPGRSGDRRTSSSQLGSPTEVDALDGPPGRHDLVAAWAWIDEDAGTVRARAFPGPDRHRRGRGNRLSGDEAVRPARPPDRHPPGPRLAHPGPTRARTASSRSAGAASLDEVRDYALP